MAKKSETKKNTKQQDETVEQFKREAFADEGVYSVPEGDDTVLVFDGFTAQVMSGDDGKHATAAANGETDEPVTSAFLKMQPSAHVTEDGEVVPDANAGATDGPQSSSAGSGGGPATRGTSSGGTGAGTGAASGGPATRGSGT
jgi:hypothetical protein